MSEGTTHGTQAVDRAAQLVSTVVRADAPLTFADLPGAAGSRSRRPRGCSPRWSAPSCWSATSPGPTSPGRSSGCYAARHDPWEELVRAGPACSRRSARTTGETVNLGVPRGDRVVQVAQVDSPLPARHPGLDRGRRPGPRSSLGKVFYAYAALPLPPGPLEQLTERAPWPTYRRCGASWPAAAGAAGRPPSTSSSSGSPASPPRSSSTRGDVVAALGRLGTDSTPGVHARRARPAADEPRRSS